MPKLTKEDKKIFEEKLKYIGLDLENLPDFLKDFKALEYRPTNRLDNSEYKVYRYIPIKDIQILISDSDRLTDVKEKYEKAKPIGEYIQSNTEEQIESFAIFLNMLKNTSISQIQELEKKQKELNNAIPYNIKFEKNYIWQIYYSEYSNEYFMLVPSNDAEYGALFYLIKEQIEQNNKYIYVPISNYMPGEDIIRKSERTDIENYLWLFTKNWPSIYEISLKDNSKKIVIVGQTKVFDSIYTKYHVELDTREEASDFYKQLKALFILQTELPEYYQFDIQINDLGEIEFYYKDELIRYDSLGEFISREYIETCKNIKDLQKKKIHISLKLDDLREQTRQKEKDFLEKQKEISTYLLYKKTFFGKVKYFFSRKKKSKYKEINKQGTVINQEKDFPFEEKKLYNIEDLVTIYAVYSKLENEIKNKKLDEEALEQKLENLSKKVENATLYLKEIDSHKKSIFEFWKFCSKDEVISLNPGEKEEKQEVENSLRKVFEYNTDRDDITIKIDKLQREALTKEEEDSIYVADSKILPILNKIKSMVKVPDDSVNILLNELKEESETEKKYDIIEYDLFGGLSEDKTKIKILGKNKHRETEKNIYQILNINKDTTLQDFKEVLKKTEITLSKAFTKVKNVVDMPIYKVFSIEDKIDLYGFNKYCMNPETELNNTTINGDELNLVKLNIKEDMPVVFYTNIMYFDNFNKTLPLGMDKSDNVLIDADNFSYILKNKKEVYTNKYFTKELDCKELITKKINIYEYDVELKRSEIKQ